MSNSCHIFAGIFSAITFLFTNFDNEFQNLKVLRVFDDDSGLFF